MVNELLRLQLFDKIHLSIVPVLFGNGVRLFQGNYPSDDFQLIDSKSYDTGLVKLIYHRKRIV